MKSQKMGDMEEEEMFDSKNEWIVFGILTKYLSVAATFGVMANIKAESNFKANNLQNSYNTKLSLTDEQYTKLVNSGEYTRSEFINDKAGYGLCQWTHYSRKAELYDYWMYKSESKDIGDIKMQAEFILYEMTPSFKQRLNEKQSASDAAEMVMLQYEKPANQTDENIAKRRLIAQAYMDEYVKNLEEVHGDNDAVKEESTDWINEWKETGLSPTEYALLKLAHNVELIRRKYESN